MSRKNWKNLTSPPPVDEEDRIINTIVELDDLTFERILKRCCDMERPINLLKQIINCWSKIRKQKSKNKINLESQHPRGYDSGLDFLAATSKEEEILFAIRRMDDYKYTDVLSKCFDKSRSENSFKDVLGFWLHSTRDRRQAMKESKSDRNNTNNIVDIISDNEVEIIELSPPISRRIAPNRISSSHSTKKIDKSPPIRIAPKRSTTNISTRNSNSSRGSSSRRKSSPTSSPIPTKQSKLNSEVESKRYSNQLFHEKLALTAEGIWTSDMEINWRVMEIEETKLTKEFENLGNRLSEFPEQHPKYAEEWKEFWENKAAVVEDAGGDAEDYDYIPEWKEFWARRMEALLRIEFNTRLDEIRKKYGMDFDTLNRIRMKKKGKTDQLNELNQNDEFQPLDGNRSTWRAASTVEKAGGGGGGPGLNELRVAATPRPIVNTYIVEPKVEGVDGCDIVQILRRMTILEGQLSYLAPEVLEFFKMAEQMELSGRGNCNVLLVNQDFLALLYKCRYRFQALAQANVLPNDVKGALNHSVQSLDLILESSKCKNILPNPRVKITGRSLKTPSPTVVETQSQSFNNMNRPRIPKLKLSVPLPENVPKPPPILPAGEVGHPYNTNTEVGRKQLTEAIMKRVEHLSIDQKERIADLMTITLVDEGKDGINDQELLEFIMQSLDPLVQSAEDHRSPPPIHHQSQPQSSTHHSTVSSVSPRVRRQENSSISPPLIRRQLSPLHWRRNQLHPEPLPQVVAPWTGDLETGTRRSIGIAIPPLPISYAQAASPPPTASGHTAVHFQTIRRGAGVLNEGGDLIETKPNIQSQFAKPYGYSDWNDHGVNTQQQQQQRQTNSIEGSSSYPIEVGGRNGSRRRKRK